MENTILIMLILSILNSVLFYSKALGINVVLFIIPLLIFIVLTLKKNKKIENKKGLLLTIPITFLSCTYFIYDNEFFRGLNLLVIPALLILMYIYTIKPTYNLSELFKNFIYLLFEPLNCVGKLYNIVKLKVDSTLNLSDQNKRKVKSVLIVIPIVIIVLILLSSADMIFNNGLSHLLKVFKNVSIPNLIGRLILMFILFTYMGAVINYLLFNFKNQKEEGNINLNIDNYTVKVLLTVLNIIYLIFDIIQIKSLMLHKVAQSINYAEYARSGFFQLMFISIINLIILLISKQIKEKENKYNIIMSIIMVALTLVIIISSFLRMYMYESAYGYTLLRLLVYVTLTTEIMLLVPTLFYIVNSKVNILKYYMIIIITVYTSLCLSPVDYIIANNNINRYYETNKIDIDYLENYSSDNIPLLIELHNKTNDTDLKTKIKEYLDEEVYQETKTKGFQEYNISKNIAYKEIKNLFKNNFIN